MKSSKSSQFVLKTNTPAPALTTRQILTPKRPSLSTNVKTSSAPAVAGRSPKSKRVGILSRRRVSASPFTRVNPPSYGLSPSSSNGSPFSIDAALSGTVSSYTPKSASALVSALDNSIPKGWVFDIHEDTPDDELSNLMEFGTQTLDISDDESKNHEVNERGKENIPPSDLQYVQPTTAHRYVSRSDMMTEEPRTPLGDLNASDYYAEGCNATSVIIVAGEKDCTEEVKPAFEFNVTAKDESTPSPTEGMGQDQDTWKELLAQVESKKATALTCDTPQHTEHESPIEIWESESAKGDSDEREQKVIATTKTLEESLSATGQVAEDLTL